MGLGQIEAQAEYSYSHNSSLITSLTQITAWAIGLESFDQASSNQLSNVISGLIPTQNFALTNSSVQKNYDLGGIHTLHANVARIYVFASNSRIYCKGFGPSSWPDARVRSNLHLSLLIPTDKKGYTDGQVYGSGEDMCCNEAFGMYYMSPNYMDINDFRVDSEERIKTHLNLGQPFNSHYGWDQGYNVSVVAPGWLDVFDPEKDRGFVWSIDKCGCEELLDAENNLLVPKFNVPQYVYCDSSFTVPIINCGDVQPPVEIRWLVNGQVMGQNCSMEITEPGRYCAEFYIPETTCKIRQCFEIDSCPNPIQTDTIFGDTLDGNPPTESVWNSNQNEKVHGSYQSDSNSMGINELTHRKELKVEVFPNPIEQTVLLKIEANRVIKKVAVHNNVGMRYIGSVSTGDDDVQIQLDTSHLPKGLYIVTIEGEDWRVTKRLLIN